VRELLEREHEIAQTLSRAESAVRMYSQQLDRAIARRAELAQGLAVREEQRDRAQEVLHELDRPLVRRLHRSEIGRARGDLNQVQGSINRSVAELADIDRDLPGVRASLAQARATVLGRPSLERECHGIRRELDRDRSARAVYLADDPPRHVLDRLGPRPERSAVSDIWDEAATRLDQHTVAFDTSDSYPHLGRSPSWEDTAMGVNDRAVARACERLDRSLGRAPVIEPPGLELGL
jgi:hypothetical protein